MVRCQDGTLYTGFTVDDPENGWLSITRGRVRSIRKAGCLSVLCGTGNGTTVMMPGPVNSI